MPIRWVLVHDPDGAFEPQAFLSTTLEMPAEDILGTSVDRWQMDGTFSEARQHLGVETQQQWSDMAIARTTPMLFGLYSLVTLIAGHLHDGRKLGCLTAAWYNKEQIAFSDAIASV